MTHTLHREGDLQNLREDYVLICYPTRGINSEGSNEKFRQIWEVVSHYGNRLANFGNMDNGTSLKIRLDDMIRSKKHRVVHAVFKDRETLKACLQEIKDRDFGMSVVVSGLYDEVEKICREIGLSPHTVNQSLGVHGKKENLPGKDVLEIITMCGHMMISKNLIAKMVKDIRKGKITPRDGAVEISKRCECGIVNTDKAENVLKKMAAL